MPFVKRRKVSLLNKLVLSFQLNRGIGKGKPNSSYLPEGICHIRKGRLISGYMLHQAKQRCSLPGHQAGS